MEKTEVFSNEALVNDVVMGLHQSFGETNSYRGRYIAYFGVNSDCEIWNNTGKKGAFTDKEGALVTYNATTDNQYMNTDNNVWAKLYEAIERANSAVYSSRAPGNCWQNARRSRRKKENRKPFQVPGFSSIGSNSVQPISRNCAIFSRSASSGTSKCAARQAMQ